MKEIKPRSELLYPQTYTIHDIKPDDIKSKFSLDDIKNMVKSVEKEREEQKNRWEPIIIDHTSLIKTDRFSEESDIMKKFNKMLKEFNIPHKKNYK